MRMRKYKRRYKKRKFRGSGLLGRDRRSWTPLYLSKANQKGGWVYETYCNSIRGRPIFSEIIK